MLSQNSAQSYLDCAIDALASGAADSHTILNALPVPVYTTDVEGNVTFWNYACIEFAGRVPRLGKDRWCVTWRIHTTVGHLLPHDQCPMAVAVKEQRAIRGTVAIAERPDGSRRAFTPYPTPLFDEHDRLIGAVNMLIDVSEEQAPALEEQARRCARLAAAIGDPKTAKILRVMADDFDRTARALTD